MTEGFGEALDSLGNIGDRRKRKRIAVKVRCKATKRVNGAIYCQLPEGHNGSHRVTLFWDSSSIVGSEVSEGNP